MGNLVSPSPSGGPAPARNEPERFGRVIVNPISGERIVVRQSGAETGGALFTFDLYLPPGGHVPAGHVHPVQEERFTVIEGQMRFRLGRQTVVARPGATVIVPPGKAHWFGAEGGQAAHAYVETRPALRMEEFFAENETLSLAGRLGGTRLPRLTDLARILLEFRREVAVPYMPAFLVRIALTPLAWLGRLRTGVRKAAPQHESD
jgi:quercetin dioxygenase-like cupin family protein